MAHVVVRGEDNLIESAVTRRSADELKLKKGDTLFAVVKATEVMIQKGGILLHIHDLEFGDLSHPTSHPFFLRNDDTIWPRFVIQRLPLLQIR
jgi:hypothetical protein